METSLFACIGCPQSCNLKVTIQDNGEILVEGNRCPRGIEFGKHEVTTPTRMLCSVVKTSFTSVTMLPVRLDGEVPKNKIIEIMEFLKKFTLTKVVGRGEIVVENILDLGVNIIASSNILKEAEGDK